MVANNTFPQSGDYDDAENFAQLIGQSNLLNYVGSGLNFSVDYTIPEVTVSQGVCYVSEASATGSQSAETRLDLGYVIQLGQTTVSLTDAAVNYIYVEPNLGTNDNSTIAVYTNESNASAGALKIGEIDTSADTSTELNRRATVDLQKVDFGEDDTDQYGLFYDDVNSRITFSSTDVDGAGTDGDIFRVNDGTSTVEFPSGGLTLSGDVNDVHQLVGVTSGRIDMSAPGEVRMYGSDFEFNKDVRVSGNVNSGSLTQGTNPADVITETTSPTGFTFSGDSGRDIHDKADVTISNPATTSATEDVTVTLYDGVDNTGTQVATETLSVSLGAGASSTTTFISGDEELDNGSYYIEITTSGTTLSVDQTDEYTKGATHSLGQTATGDLYVRNQDGTDALTVDAITENIELKGDLTVPYQATFKNANDTASAYMGNSLKLFANNNAHLDVGNDVYIDIDDANNSTTNKFEVTHDGGATTLFRLNEGGPAEVLNSNLQVNAPSSASGNLVVRGSSSSVRTLGIQAGASGSGKATALQFYDDVGGDLGSLKNYSGGAADSMWLQLANTANTYFRLHDTPNSRPLAMFHSGGDFDLPYGSLTQGTNPADVITETTSPTGFTFSGDSGRDIHNKTDVTISNPATTSATEDVTVSLYNGVDNTGTLVASETISVSLAAGASSTTTFISGNRGIDNGSYYIEVTTSGTTLSVDQTDEYTKGATYEIGQGAAGDLFIRNQDGVHLLNLDAQNGNIHLNERVEMGDVLDMNGYSINGADSLGIESDDGSGFSMFSTGDRPLIAPVVNGSAQWGKEITYTNSQWNIEGSPKAGGYTIWTAGNDGAGSGLDSDTVDGKHASAFATPSDVQGAYGSTIPSDKKSVQYGYWKGDNSTYSSPDTGGAWQTVHSHNHDLTGRVFMHVHGEVKDDDNMSGTSEDLEIRVLVGGVSVASANKDGADTWTEGTLDSYVDITGETGTQKIEFQLKTNDTSSSYQDMYSELALNEQDVN